MQYVFHQVGDTYVVWLASANRFMQLKEPAFRILEDWVFGLSESQIVKNCTGRFKLQKVTAKHFVKEVTSQLELLSSQSQVEPIISRILEVCFLPDDRWFSVKCYRINGKNFRFRYSHQYLEELIHPGFGYLEMKVLPPNNDHCFDISQRGGRIFLNIGEPNSWSCPDTMPEYFVGLVYVQLLNGIYDTTDSHWMGAIHASAVTAGNGALLFTAKSGSGKSTFAAKLMNQGYRVLSDDFSPLCLKQGMVYPFPEGISIKNRSLELIKPFYQYLIENEDSLSETVRELFLPIVFGDPLTPEPVKGIVFLKYDTSVEFDLKKISQLETMDHLLQQSWLVPGAERAVRWMEWYMEIPCYTLSYSATMKAIQAISKLVRLMTYKEIYYFTGQCLSLEEHPIPREQFVQKIRQEGFCWAACMQLWSEQLIIPALYLQFQKQDLLSLLPHVVSQTMATIYYLNCRRNASIVEQVQRICRVLEGCQIHPVFLTGTANLLDGLYTDLGERIIHNIDLLVNDSDYLQAARILQDIGYMRRSASFLDFKILSHFPTQFKKQEQALVELHRQPVPKRWASPLSAAMLLKACKAVPGSPGLFVPCDAHKLIHTFIHSQQADWSRACKPANFRGFNDLYRLSKRLDVFNLVTDTPYQTRAVAWMTFAQRILGLPLRFFPLKTRDARWYTWKYDLSLNHSRIYAVFSLAIKGLDVFFVSYPAGWCKALFQQSQRLPLYRRL